MSDQIDEIFSDGQFSDYSWDDWYYEWDDWADDHDEYDEGSDGGYTPTASDSDGDGQIDEIIVVNQVVSSPLIFIPISYIELNWNNLFENIFEFFEDLNDDINCYLVKSADSILEGQGSTFTIHGQGGNVEVLFDAVQTLMQANAAFGHTTIVNGYSLTDLLSNLGSLSFYEGTSTEGYGDYFPDVPSSVHPHSILIDIDKSSFLGENTWQTDQFIFEVILHEIAHAQELYPGGADVPWDTHMGPGNSLEYWAEDMSVALRDLANANGYDSLSDLMDSFDIC